MKAEIKAKWVAMVETGYSRGQPVDHSLSELNDDGTDFERIADLIQKGL